MSTAPFHATPEDIANAEPGDWLVSMGGQPIAQRVDTRDADIRWRLIETLEARTRRVPDERAAELAIIRNAVVLDLEHVRRSLARMVEPATTEHDEVATQAAIAPDVELEALERITSQLQRLDPESRRRALTYTVDRWGHG